MSSKLVLSQDEGFKLTSSQILKSVAERRPKLVKPKTP
jgi:hypothetical protein